MSRDRSSEIPVTQQIEAPELEAKLPLKSLMSELREIQFALQKEKARGDDASQQQIDLLRRQLVEVSSELPAHVTEAGVKAYDLTGLSQERVVAQLKGMQGWSRVKALITERYGKSPEDYVTAVAGSVRDGELPVKADFWLTTLKKLEGESASESSGRSVGTSKSVKPRKAAKQKSTKQPRMEAVRRGDKELTWESLGQARQQRIEAREEKDQEVPEEWPPATRETITSLTPPKPTSYDEVNSQTRSTRPVSTAERTEQDSSQEGHQQELAEELQKIAHPTSPLDAMSDAQKDLFARAAERAETEEDGQDSFWKHDKDATATPVDVAEPPKPEDDNESKIPKSPWDKVQDRLEDDDANFWDHDPEREDNDIDNEDDNNREKGPGTPEGGPDTGKDFMTDMPEVPQAEQMQAHTDLLVLGIRDQIKAIAELKESREKLFSGGRSKEAFHEATDKLNDVFAQYLESTAAQYADLQGVRTDLEAHKGLIEGDIAQNRSFLEMTEAQDMPEQYKAAIRQKIEIKIAHAEAALEVCVGRIADVDRLSTKTNLEASDRLVLEMATVRSRIEEAQAELKSGSMVEKFKNMWRKHPKTRLAIGVGLGVGGLVVGGAAAVPLVALGIGMRSVGSGIGTEAAVNTGHKWRADRRERKQAASAHESSNTDVQGEAGQYAAEIAGRDGVSESEAVDVQRFLERHGDDLFAQNRVSEVMRGEGGIAGEVASTLLAEQLDRVKSDAKSNRTAKIAGATVGVAVGAFGVYRGVSGLHHKGGGAHAEKTSNLRPHPPGEQPYNPDLDRMRGIASANPDAGESMARMTANATSEQIAQAAQNNETFQHIYEGLSQGMNREQLSTFNQVIGRMTQEGGRYFMDPADIAADNRLLPAIAGSVKQGASANALIQRFQLGPANL